MPCTIADGFHVGSAYDRHAQRSLTQEYSVADPPADRAQVSIEGGFMTEQRMLTLEQVADRLQMSWVTVMDDLCPIGAMETLHMLAS